MCCSTCKLCMPSGVRRQKNERYCPEHTQRCGPAQRSFQRCKTSMTAAHLILLWLADRTPLGVLT